MKSRRLNELLNEELKEL